MSENEETSQKQEVSTTPFIDLPTRFDRWEPLAEVIVTVVLAFATLATAWSGRSRLLPVWRTPVRR